MIDGPEIPTSLHLDAIVAAGWADPGGFPALEYAKARAFYASLRRHDQRLLRVREAVAAEIQAWTGRVPRDVGSFGLRLNLESSDLDLGIGYPPESRERIAAALRPHAVFKGERQTRFTTTRLVYLLERDGVEIDLSVLTEEDFVVACRMLDEIDATMSEQERVAHTWVKHLLWSSGRLDAYAAWKLVTYRRFCPEFSWVPISQNAVTGA
ncbi:MAG: hypothetical protein ACRDYA_17240 [Egibacteraceae bacterium]